MCAPRHRKTEGNCNSTAEFLNVFRPYTIINSHSLELPTTFARTGAKKQGNPLCRMQKGNSFVSIDMPKVDVTKPGTTMKTVRLTFRKTKHHQGCFLFNVCWLECCWSFGVWEVGHGHNVCPMCSLLDAEICRYIHNWLSWILDVESAIFPQAELVVRVFCVGMVVACNSILWNFLAKSMDLSSSVDAVVINNAFNFFFTVCNRYCPPLILSRPS